MGTVYNTQDECGEVMLNIKASDRCFLPDAGPREDDTGSIILKGLSTEGAVGFQGLVYTHMIEQRKMQASGCSAGLEVLLIAGVSAHPQQAAAGT
ncbi:hypothetical protein Anapl_15331 [Anas platyrhynchos]|uniref:Uncharacterized protein n=1 Tax=Anas platyrhynchos TaxID=8839 RepID=R0JTV7_ANAPL|nr:hypothetical protein Anapl_15331 [Anas platyrhynchos]